LSGWWTTRLGRGLEWTRREDRHNRSVVAGNESIKNCMAMMGNEVVMMEQAGAGGNKSQEPAY